MPDYIVRVPTIGVEVFRVSAPSKEDAIRQTRGGSVRLIEKYDTHVEEEATWEVERVKAEDGEVR